ncbi:glycoside hydrolase family protein [Salimicrobium halophilum]|uniref:Uncharacterized protein n=1 Tax=Salimicrobium halophilum TaxID=86666 RepID=A0A1G8S9J7_9BACI|nr:hypothetical protein [Salimicrobium halophilum]SDJ25908.1 hypothetical protein SAMN04490247_1331 [Salimicrobium halophilum]
MIAVFGDVRSFEFSGENVEYFRLEDLETEMIDTYSQVVINGWKDEKASVLSYDVMGKLWTYVEAGGRLYGEMINCEDFPSSRLFGFKQDFPVTYRRLEKLKVSEEGEAQLGEWNGPFLTGFSFDADVWMEIGVFKETLATEEEGELPALIHHPLGKGATLFSAIPLLGNEQLWTLRPSVFFERIAECGLFPAGRFKKEIDVRKRAVNETISDGLGWFFQSGIMPESDGSKGVYENVHAFRGNVSEDIRPDCNAHTALLFHLAGKYTGNAEYESISENIFSYLFEERYQDTEEDSVTRGFWKWFRFPTEKPDQIFTDDNSWMAIVLLYLYRETGKEAYRERGLLTLEAMYRTQNRLGLRMEAIRRHELEEKGEEYFRESDSCSMNPHFESIAHAAFFQGYVVNGEEKYRDIALKGIDTMLEKDLTFMYSKTAGYSRFLLALSYAYKLTGKDVYKEEMDRIAAYLLSHQQKYGGIEEADNPDPDRYGAEDTGVFRYNGEGISDQLYTNNFLLMNSWEAFLATGDERYEELAEDLADYVRTIQIVSPHNTFHGAWMRAFCHTYGEYFGNNGDTGWGAYCSESGWTNALLLSGLMMREMNHSLLEVGG